MGSLLRSRITLVWFGLIAATALSWGMGHELGHGMGFNSARQAGVAILVVAFVKSWPSSCSGSCCCPGGAAGA